MVVFEFDEEKSLSNRDKHGMDFYSAQELWKDPDLVEIEVKSEDEPRFLVIGRIMARHWSAVITYRNESVRLISVRRSRKKEVELYESERFR